MTKLTEYTRYEDAQRFANSHALWELFDGDREHLNIAHECINRHADGSGRTAVRIAHADGTDTALSFDEMAAGSARFAHWLVQQGIHPGDRIAFMLEPSLPFYLSLFGAMMMGAISVPLFTLFGLDGLRLRVDDCKPKLLITNAEKAGIANEIEGLRVVVADDALLGEIAALSRELHTGDACRRSCSIPIYLGHDARAAGGCQAFASHGRDPHVRCALRNRHPAGR